MNNNIAFMFPGQGSQSVAMLADYAAQYPSFLKIFQQASKILGYDLWDIIEKGPEEKLNLTIYTQPALLVASYALWQICLAEGLPKPHLLMGHSLGEYTALLCADVINFDDAVKIVAKRAELMQEAVPEHVGAMGVIIGLEDDVVSAICKDAAQHEVVEPANFNSPGQVVVGGHRQAVLRVIEQAEKQNAKLAKLLPMSVPSHCSLVRDAALKLFRFIEQIEFHAPKIPIIQNVDAQIHLKPHQIKANLERQLYHPVLWAQSVQHATSLGNNIFVECGPGKVLAGLQKRINRDTQALSLSTIESLQQTKNIIRSSVHV